MAYKDLLVVVDSEPRSRDRMVIAAALAERLRAHLVGLYVAANPEPPGRLDYFNSDAPLLGPLYRDIEELIAPRPKEHGFFSRTSSVGNRYPPSGGWPREIPLKLR